MNRETLKLTAKIIASETKPLYKLAQSKGINMPHPSLGIFKSVLAEIEQPNANGIRLGASATKEAVSTLIGCQINYNHLRAGHVLGHIIDAEINSNNDIEVTCIFFRDIYQEQYQEAMELFAQNELTMSFELSADIESQDKLQDGTKRLNDYYFTGAGLLFGLAPACKKARVFELATRNLYNQLTIERQSLIFANNQNTKKSIMGVLIKVTNKAEEIKAEEIKAEEIEKVIEPIVEVKIEEVTPEVLVVIEPENIVEEVKAEEPLKIEEPVVEAPSAIISPEVDTLVNDQLTENKQEVIAEDVPMEETTIKLEPSTVTVEETRKMTDTVDPNQMTETVKVETTMTVKQNDKTVQKETQVTETTYTYAQVEEIKATYEKQVAELNEKLVAKDAEIVKIKETSDKLAVLKLELGSNEFAKNFTDADYLDVTKVENAKLKFAATKKEEVIATSDEVVLSTGHKKIDASEDVRNPLTNVLRNKKSNKR